MLVRVKQRQKGFTLLELMIGLAVGLIVVSGVLTVYLSTVESSGSTLKSSRLNSEMSALMNIMGNDIRRAGFWGSPNFILPHTNPFSFIDSANAANTTALRVHSNSSGSWTDVTYAATPNGSCITYSYDHAPGTVGTDGAVDNNEKYAFRWNGGSDDPIQMRTSTTGGTNLCSDTNATWESITDTDTTQIIELTFDLSNSKCMNSAEPNDQEDGGDPGVVDDLTEYDCYTVIPAAGSGDRTLESREVLITLTAALKSDPLVKATMTQSVQVRNNLVRIR